MCAVRAIERVRVFSPSGVSARARSPSSRRRLRERLILYGALSEIGEGRPLGAALVVQTRGHAELEALFDSERPLDAFADRDVHEWDFGGRPETKPVLREPRVAPEPQLPNLGLGEWDGRCRDDQDSRTGERPGVAERPAEDRPERLTERPTTPMSSVATNDTAGKRRSRFTQRDPPRAAPGTIRLLPS